MSRFHPIERVTTDDLMSLASERGSTPMQVGAVLLLDGRERLDPGLVADAFAERILAVPRLRQRLVKGRWGSGRPVWVDDRDFTIANHFSIVSCPAPGGEGEVLRVAAGMLLTRLPGNRPLWAAKLVTDIGHGGSALIVVFHHVLADGIGGLAVLGSLADSALPDRDFLFPGETPRCPPTYVQLAAEAAKDRIRSARRLPRGLRRLGIAVAELRPALGVRTQPSSLNRPTGPRRRFATVRVDLSETQGAAHAHGATVNDVVLSAIAVALHRLLMTRGERVDEFVISVPFSARGQTSANDLGNKSGVIPINVPGVGDPARRLESLAEITRAAKRMRPGASNALLGPLFRLLAWAGLFRWFIDRQRRIHTFASNLRGPESRLSFLGCPITGIIPLSVPTGNVTVSFAVLSYDGTLTVTLTADPDACPDLSELRDVLNEELNVLTALTHRRKP